MITLEKRKTIKRGSNEWWTWIAMLQAAKQERKRLRLPPMAPVTIDLKLCNQLIVSINRNPLKKLWFLLTNGDLHPAEWKKLGNEAAIKAEDGVVHNFFKKD